MVRSQKPLCYTVPFLVCISTSCWTFLIIEKRHSFDENKNNRALGKKSFQWLTITELRVCRFNLSMKMGFGKGCCTTGYDSDMHVSDELHHRSVHLNCECACHPLNQQLSGSFWTALPCVTVVVQCMCCWVTPFFTISNIYYILTKCLTYITLFTLYGPIRWVLL